MRKARKLFFLLIFWALVFLLNVGPDWQKYTSAREVIDVIGSVTLLQFAIAYVALRWLVPHFLDNGRIWVFSVALLALLIIAAELNVLLSYFYLEPTYPNSYGLSYAQLSGYSLIERMGFSPMIKYLAFSKLPFYFFPAAMLVAVNYYQKQQDVLQLKEKKRAAELDALKSRLNPHFIFNTLNNIYALAIKQSPRTAEAVAKLSEILDYVLHRGSQATVSLREEVEMIEAYVALEQLRFGDRVNVTVANTVSGERQIPPLLTLTLLENAFKHGATQTLSDTDIDIGFSESAGCIEIVVTNTKPPGETADSPSTPIGLDNLRRQLALLYSDTDRLAITTTGGSFTAKLTLDLQ